MKRYSFPLERVLSVRRGEEQRAAAELAAARRAHESAVTRLAAHRAAYESLPALPEAAPAAVFLARRDRLALAGVVVTAAAGRRTDAEAGEERSRTAWARARQRVSALERLDERRRLEWGRRARWAEDRAVDDLVTRLRGR